MKSKTKCPCCKRSKEPDHLMCDSCAAEAERDLARQHPDYDPTGDGDWNETTNL